MEKKYKLLQDLPDVKLGSPVYWDEMAKEYYVVTDKESKIYFQESSMDNVEWFEPLSVSEPLGGEKIEVRVFEPTSYQGHYRLITVECAVIPEEKFPAIKSAIESVLNPSPLPTSGIPLPKDFVEFNSIGVVYPDGRKEPLFPNTPEKEFVWTDELVLLLADLAHHKGWHKFNDIKIVDLFDQVKKQAKGAGYQYPQWVYDHLSKKSPAEKPVTEESGWEIAEIKSSLGNVCKRRHNGNYSYDAQGDEGVWTLEVMMKDQTNKIHSVLRKSDNQLFSIGDWVEHEKGNDKGFINKITIEDGTPLVYYTGLFDEDTDFEFWNSLKVLRKPSKPITLDTKPAPKSPTQEEIINAINNLY